MLKYNGSILKVSNGASVIGSITFSPTYPSDMDFIYLAKNLTSGYTWTTTNTSTKAMGTRMHTFYAGSSGEASLDRFYACAGIARATTAEEDTQIKDYLMSQGT